MHTSKMRPQMGACEINKQGRSNDEGSSCCLSLRCWLLVWACIRLVVSVLWTITLLLWSNLDSLEPERANYDSNAVLAFGVIATLAQLVEFGMLVTFIIAGIKRSAHLYRSYYRYCILTLIIYIVAVVLCFTLGYYDGHWFGEIYLTYHFNDFAVKIIKNDEILFGAAAILDICLEILLIYSIKRLINKYQYNAGYGFGENI